MRVCAALHTTLGRILDEPVRGPRFTGESRDAINAPNRASKPRPSACLCTSEQCGAPDEGKMCRGSCAAAEVILAFTRCIKWR